MVNMDTVYLLLGIFLLVVAFVDLLGTTLWLYGGAGPLTTRFTRWVWQGFQRVGSKHSRAMSLVGPVLVMFTLTMWILLLWTGWTFVFASGENVLIDTHGSESVSWTGRIYYVGYTLFTLGIGDIIPTEGTWQIVTILATGNGMLFVTMSVSYILSVLNAVIQKRTFASSITGLGKDSEEFLLSGWTGENFRGFELLLTSLSSDLENLTYQHKAYPILHYYHSQEDQYASAIAVAIFDEALTLLRFGVEESDRLQGAPLASARSSAKSHLQTLHSVFIPPAEAVPDPPNLDQLRAAGIPTVSDEEFAEALNQLSERRRRLLSLVNADARNWPQ